MGKEVNDLYKLIPCRSKCKRLSKEIFKDTAMIWLKASESAFESSIWVLETRARLKTLQVDLSRKEYYPAPTAQEFTEKMQDCFVRVEGSNLGDYLAQWVKSDSQSYWGHGKTPVIALYSCYMNYKRRT